MSGALERICVVGAGIMGRGIAQVSLLGGFQVSLYDTDPSACEEARRSIAIGLKKAARANRLTEEEVSRALARFQIKSTLPEAVEGCGCVIEAVAELLEVKQKVFRQLGRLAAPDVILATNTSQIAITQIAAASEHPERVIGMHWFNPPTHMKLIEVVPGLNTYDAIKERMVELCRRLGKEPVVVKDRRGFLVNRALGVFLAECLRMFEEGVSTAEEIDTAMKLGLGHPMGPFELADLIGLDTMLHAGEQMHQVYGERRLPPQILRLMVAAGRLGRKSGRGFYDYSSKTAGEKGERGAPQYSDPVAGTEEVPLS